MKKFPYPKVYGPPSPVGQASSRALDNVDAPFLTRRVGNTITDKAGEFTNVRTVQSDSLGFITVFAVPTELTYDEPTMKHPFVSRPIGGSRDKNVTSTMGRPPTNSLDPTDPQPGSSFMNGRVGAVHVGGGYVLWFRHSYQRDQPNTNYSLITTWPVLSYVRAPGLEKEPDEENKSVSYGPELFTAMQAYRPTTKYDNAKHLADLVGAMMPASVFALGQNDDGDYVFGVSMLTYTLTPSVNILRYQIAVGNTRTKTLEIKFTRDCGDLPATGANSGNSGLSRVFCTGRGKARALYMACTNADMSSYNINNVSMYTVRTDDFGETWTMEPEPVLESTISPWIGGQYLASNSAGDPGIDQHVLMGYIGDGKHFLYFSAGDTDGYTSQVSPNTNTTTRPVLFIGDDTGYTPVVWPADGWRCAVNGPLSSCGQRGWMNRSGYTWRLPLNFITVPPWGSISPWDFVRNDVYSLTYYDEISRGLTGPTPSWAADEGAKSHHWSFGVGCIMVPIRHWNPKAWKIMYTTDFGDTWTTKDLPEELWPVSYRSPPMVVLAPWKEDVSDGTILIGKPVQDTTQMSWWKTTDLFTTFKKVVTMSAGVDLPYTEFDPAGTNGDTGLFIFDNQRIAPPYPAFPDDFKGE